MVALVLAYNRPSLCAYIGKPFVVLSILGEKLVVVYDSNGNAYQPEGFRNPPPDASVEKQCVGRNPTDH